MNSLNLHEDVWNDLLVLHLADEASGETRRLVEQRLASDPSFAAAAERARHDAQETSMAPGLLATSTVSATGAAGVDLERRALSATKHWLRLRQTLFGLALAALLIPLSFTFDESGLRHFALRDAPGTSGLLLAASAILWVAWYGVNRRTRATGL